MTYLLIGLGIVVVSGLLIAACVAVMRDLARNRDRAGAACQADLQTRLVVRAEWDAEASAWIAASDDVPGLFTEAPTVEGLVAKLKKIVPELLAANGCMSPDHEISIELLARRCSAASSAEA